jgi:2-phospho-L-lactate guanylyltransferase
MTGGTGWTVLVPLRDLGGGKTRLATWLSPEERRELTRYAAAAVVSACQQTAEVERIVVVTGSAEASDWAAAAGVIAWPEPPGRVGLVGVMEAALAAHSNAQSRIAVVMGDLPLANAAAISRCLRRADRRPVTLVPSRSGAGTNMLAFTGGAQLALALGAPDSLAQLRRAARAAGLRFQTVPSAPLALDVDDADDLRLLARVAAARRLLAFLARF